MNTQLYQRILMIILSLAATNSDLSSQPSQGTADLSSPSLQVHATLPQIDFPGTPLVSTLARGQTVAASKGLTAAKGIDKTVIDEPIPRTSPPSTSPLYHK